MTDTRDELLDPEDLTGRSEAPAGVERRRPGRRDDVSPHLVTLLRQPAGGAGLRPEDTADDLRAPTGLLVSAALSALIWAGLLLGLRSLIAG